MVGYAGGGSSDWSGGFGAAGRETYRIVKRSQQEEESERRP